MSKYLKLNLLIYLKESQKTKTTYPNILSRKQLQSLYSPLKVEITPSHMMIYNALITGVKCLAKIRNAVTKAKLFASCLFTC